MHLPLPTLPSAPSRLLALLPLLALLGAAPAAAAPQDDPPDDRPAVEAMLEELAELVKKSSREDPRERRAVGVIQSLGEEWKRSGEGDRDDIVRGLDRVFLAKRRPNKDGSQATGIYVAAAKALGRAEDDGAKKLVRWIGNRRHKDDVELQSELVLALGKTRSDAAIDTLEDLLDEDVPEVLGATAKAIGEMSGKDQKVRKRLFESLLKTMESAQENARSQDSTAQALWGALNGSGSATLGKLSGTRQNGTVAWRRWWNKNKRASWNGRP